MLKNSLWIQSANSAHFVLQWMSNTVGTAFQVNVIVLRTFQISPKFSFCKDSSSDVHGAEMQFRFSGLSRTSRKTSSGQQKGGQLFLAAVLRLCSIIPVQSA